MDRYFEILNLRPGSTFDEVKKAYRNMVKVWHPDRFPMVSPRLQEKAHHRLSEINEAYKKLESYYKLNERPPERDPLEILKSFFYRSQFGSVQNLQPDEILERPRMKLLVLAWTNGDRYEGEVLDDRMHGKGTYLYAGGNRYVGEFRHGRPHGEGTLVFANGDVYTGHFDRDTVEGRGTYIYANGDKFKGTFKNGLPHGQGTYFIRSSGNSYSGRWENGSFMGQESDSFSAG